MTVSPLRRVRHAELRSGGSIGKPEVKYRWWDLQLDCGHFVERRCRYQPGGPRGWGRLLQGRPAAEVLPAPRNVRCEFCRGE